MKKFLAVLMMLPLLACADSSDVKPGMGSSFNITQRKYDRIWNASIVAVTDSGMAILESDKEKGVIKAEKGAGLASWGEIVGVFITPPGGANKYTVEVVSLKRSTTQITGQNWEQSISQRIKSELSM